MNSIPNVRIKVCGLCGTKTGLWNKECKECDSTNFSIIELDLSGGGNDTIQVSYSRSIRSFDEGLETQRDIVGSRWNRHFDGHGFALSPTHAGDSEINRIDLYWYIPLEESSYMAGLVEHIKQLDTIYSWEGNVVVDYRWGIDEDETYHEY